MSIASCSAVSPSGNPFAHLGKPREWRCDRCGMLFTIYPALPFDHDCAVRDYVAAEPKDALYWHVMRDDGRVAYMCVANPGDPNQTVETLAPDGSTQLWRKAEGDGVLRFYPPDGYTCAQGLVWRYDKRLQRHHPAPPDVMLREAHANRVSVNFKV